MIKNIAAYIVYVLKQQQRNTYGGFISAVNLTTSLQYHENQQAKVNKPKMA